MKLDFLIRIAEGTSVITEEGNLNIDDFPLSGFVINIDEEDVISQYYQYIEEKYPNCQIEGETFLVYPFINDETLGEEISEDIDPDEVNLEVLENWFKSEGPKQWFRNYQIDKKLGIKDFNLEDVSSFSEEQLEILMNEIENNPSIIVPHYLLKSQIMEYLPIRYKRHDTVNSFLDEMDEEGYLEMKDIIKDNLSLRVKDAIQNNLQEWLDDEVED